jgi:hypothetical protein
LVDGSNYFREAGNTIARNVSMVGQSIESRTRSSLVVPSRSLEGMLASNVDGLLRVDEKPLGMLVLLD